jgi:hypothetical protein
LLIHSSLNAPWIIANRVTKEGERGYDKSAKRDSKVISMGIFAVEASTYLFNSIEEIFEL